MLLKPSRARSSVFRANKALKELRQKLAPNLVKELRIFVLVEAAWN
jgi:hypothetical protein